MPIKLLLGRPKGNMIAANMLTLEYAILTIKLLVHPYLGSNNLILSYMIEIVYKLDGRNGSSVHIF